MFQRINHQQQFHQARVDRRTRGLHNKHITFPHIFLNLDKEILIGEFLDFYFSRFDIQIRTNLVHEALARVTAENFQGSACSCCHSSTPCGFR